MRVKRAVNARKKRKKILKAAKGYRGALSRRYTLAKEQYLRNGNFEYADRKKKKRNYRRLWVTRINAAARMEGMKYNELIHGLKLANVNINRKMLAEIAATDMESFKEYVNIAKEALKV
ncbi:MULTISPECIES: 50S ribosomal protein L20 [Oceanotoga]|jgi:large subunit ribosomal protein L20|uniref:Large ribosomal subunit protein bL20 n=1 Tax=Oceanotoga teriensis TaxID=515440 RepID=A0AA45C515_9BACT|nr:large subunit ribosomal protein [Oceanotoga sp.]MDO7977691.1 50S ribosomal protein L20 [Oceanotoga teriensis]PWJ87530.1 LSU ribosomal protein L20P [Oceanotoga teriensis]